MEPSRPLAKRRLEHALEKSIGVSEAESLSLNTLRRKLGVLSQEKRFLMFLFLMRREGYFTSQDIALGIEDIHSNVQRNLHALLKEGLVLAHRDAASGIARFSINRPMLEEIAAFFRQR